MTNCFTISMDALNFRFPILSCEAAKAKEAQHLADEAAAWDAMCAAGAGVAAALLRDLEELRVPGDALRVLVLCGKGNNGGDAMIAAGELLARFPRSRVRLVLTTAPEALSALAGRAFEGLKGRVQTEVLAPEIGKEGILEWLHRDGGAAGYDCCIDGILGMSFRPPLRAPARALIEAVNAYERIGLRAAVDLPSGRGDASDTLSFRADFTYATGIAKTPLFQGVASCGRVRFVDLGFFAGEAVDRAHEAGLVATREALRPLCRLRPADVDKREFGHLFIVGGSAYMPGALLMAVKAAVRSGVGLVTAFAPASVAAHLSAAVPEAMWVPWPETANGTLSPRALPLLLERVEDGSAVLVGPGLGRDRNTEQVAQEIVRSVEQPVVLDADALRPRVVELVPKRKRGVGPVVLTPHMGEFMRMAKLSAPDDSNAALRTFCRHYKVTTVLKAPLSRICDGSEILFNIHGGPVLSRGGSGDLLCGLIGGILAQPHKDPIDAVARGVVLHGLAAERWAREAGQICVHTTQLLDFLPAVLRACDS